MRKCVNWLFLAGAGLLLVVGILIFHYAILPILLHKQIAGTLALNNNTEAYDRFVKLPVPLYFRLYFFNVVNPDGIVRGEKPIVKEVGPWVYKETREKFNIEFDDEKDTVKYQQKSFLHFDAELSKPLTKDDYVQPANVIPQLVFNIAERVPELEALTELLDFGLPQVLRENYGLRLNATVDDILFKGLIAHCPPNGSLSVKAVCSIVEHFPGLRGLEKMPNGDLNVGLLRFRNDTLSDVFEIYRGNHDFSRIGEIVSINGKPDVSNWFGPECNQVKGSYDESLLRPFLSKDSHFSVYGADICTPTPMSCTGDSSAKGIDCLRFAPSDQFLGSVTDYPENYCYCPGSIHDITLPQGCLKKGALEISACQSFPIVATFPHFLQASPVYQNAIEGLNPQTDLHETYVDLEPTTGVPVTGAKRVQINMEMKGTPALKITGNARHVLFPFIWIDESVELAEAQLSMLKDQLLKVLNIANIVRWVLVGIGSLMFLVGCVMAYVSAKREHRHPD